MRLPPWGMVLALVVVFVCAMGAAAFAQGSGNINAFLGSKSLDEDWEPVEDQVEAGIEFDFKGENWPISIAIDLLASGAEEEVIIPFLGNVNFEGKTTEFNLGVRKIWEPTATIRPFLGGGLAFISGEYSGASGPFLVSDDDTGTGFWLGGGIYWTLVEHFNLGFEAKISSAEINIYGVDVNAGGGHFGLLLGYHW